jgi:hypothetical protein
MKPELSNTPLKAGINSQFQFPASVASTHHNPNPNPNPNRHRTAIILIPHNN